MTYEYCCEKCNSLIEIEQAMSENTIEICPLCDNADIDSFYKKFSCIICITGNSLMSVAERNTRDMGYSEIQERQAKKKATREKFLTEQAEKVGGKLIKETGKKTLFEEKYPGKKFSQVKNVKKFIEEGVI